MDAQFQIRVAVFAVALPAAVSLLALAPAWLRRSRTEDPRGFADASPPRYVAAALPLAVAIGWPLAGEGWRWPVVSGGQWVPWALAVLAFSALALGGALERARWSVMFAGVVGSGILAWLVARNALASAPTVAAIGTVAALAAVGGAMTAAASALGRQPGAGPPLLLILCCICSAAVWGLTGHIQPIVAAVAVSAAAGGVVIVAWFRPALRLGGAGAGALGAMLGLFASLTCTLGDTPLAANALLAAGMIAAPLSGLTPPGARPGWVGLLCRAAMVLAPGAAAVALALANQPPRVEGYPY